MISISELEKRLALLSRDTIEILLEIHNIVTNLAPYAEERLDPKGITYFDSTRGGPVKAGICQIQVKSDSLRLVFIHGSFLPDPAKLLRERRTFVLTL